MKRVALFFDGNMNFGGELIIPALIVMAIGFYVRKRNRERGKMILIISGILLIIGVGSCF